MRYRLAFATLLLPLAGCVVPPPGPYGYPQPGYPQPGYPAAYSQQDFAYPGFSVIDGSPVYVDAGVTWPLIFYGGGWGYWDGYHRWHGAPGPVGGWLGRRYPGGVGYRPYGGGPFGGRPGEFRGGYNTGPHVVGGPPGGFRPGGPPGAPGRGPVMVPRAAPAAVHAAPPSRSHDEHR